MTGIQRTPEAGRPPRAAPRRLSRLPSLVLASASPRRRALLLEAGLGFRVLTAAVEEVAHRHLTPREICLLNAHRKALAVARLRPAALVIGADTLVCLRGRIFGKPADLAEARRMLRQLQGRTHQVITGVCLLHARSGRRRLFAETTQVTFRRLTDKHIRAYLRQVNPLDKAGAYGIQEHGDAIVRRVSGSYSNVVGLPVERLREELDRWRARSAGPIATGGSREIAPPAPALM